MNIHNYPGTLVRISLGPKSVFITDNIVSIDVTQLHIYNVKLPYVSKDISVTRKELQDVYRYRIVIDSKSFVVRCEK